MLIGSLLLTLSIMMGGDPAALYLKPESFVTVEGQRIHYRTRGKGYPIIFIHGFCGSTFSWRYQLESLSKDFKLFALDLKGFGFSDKPKDGDYSPKGQARVVAQFMDRLAIKKAHIVGHSMGGLVAQALALEYPKKVDRLILVSSVAGGIKKVSPERPRFSELRLWILKKIASAIVRIPYLGKAVMRAIVKSSMKRIVYDEKIVLPEVVEGYVAPLVDPQFIEVLFSMGEDVLSGSFSPGKIPHQTLLLWGKEDGVVPLQAGKKLEKEIPKTTLVVLPKTGHLPAEEVPQKFNQALLRFLEKAE